MIWGLTLVRISLQDLVDKSNCCWSGNHHLAGGPLACPTQRRHRVRGRNTQGSCSKPATFLQWWCTSICRKPTCQHHSCTSIPVERTLHHPHSPHKICVEHVEKINLQVKGTPPKFNSSPLKNIEKWWFDDYFSFWESLWKRGCVKLPGSNLLVDAIPRNLLYVHHFYGFFRIGAVRLFPAVSKLTL